MSRFWSDVVHQLTPYVPGEQPKTTERLIKLNTNESPYGPSPQALAAIAAATGDDLRRYPDPEGSALRAAIADYYAVDTEQVFVGNGSDELLAFTFQALLKHNQPLLYPSISYSFYPVYCRLYDIEARQIPLREDFRIAVEDYQPPNGGIILANPNAPTGRVLPLADIRTLAANNPDSPVVIDEAYIDFGGESAAALIRDHDNLLVLQTLSKSRALAGLRVGFAMGHPDLVSALNKVKNSFNSYPLDRLALAGAEAAIRDRGHFEQSRQKVIATRERLSEALSELGFTVIPSAANFVFTTHPKQSAEQLFNDLRERHIIVRYFAKPPLDNYLRISIGTDAETDALLEALRALL